MLDASFINAIAALKDKERPAQIVRDGAMPKNEFFFWDDVDHVYKRVVEATKDTYEMADLKSLAAWCNAQTDPVDVFVTFQRATAYVKDPTKSCAYINFNLSNAFSYFAGLALNPEGEAYEQRRIIKLLATRLRGFTPEGMIGDFRKLKFTQNSSGESNIQATKANIGRSLEAEITGEIKPQYLCTVPVLDNPQLGVSPVTLPVITEIDLDNRLFGLYISPDVIEGAKLYATRELMQNIAALTGGLTAAQSTAVAGAEARPATPKKSATIVIYQGVNRTAN